MELIGLIFILGLFACLGTTAVGVLFAVFGIIGLFTLIPADKKHFIRPAFGWILVVGSILLFISI